ncbi:MAG: signal peptidase I [Candidatus Omnitrophica bacterium]|nr:signal peptidase I [Candidatus Omnitrophota bacterium]
MFYDKWLTNKHARYWVKEWVEPFLIALILALFIRTFFVQAFKIPTGSMRETLLEKDRILVNKLVYRFRDPERGEIIVFKYPVDRKRDFIKRLIAVGGETVEIKDGDIYINGKLLTDHPIIRQNYYYNREDWQYGRSTMKIKVPEDSFFVLGDNSGHSSDSRNWGFVHRSALVGKAFFIYWPPNRWRVTK